MKRTIDQLSSNQKQVLRLMTVLLLVIAVASGCNRTESNQKLITVSILPQKYFIDVLTNEGVEVNVMVPPGSSHATYSPTSMQFKKLSDSKMYMGIGHLGYEEAWMSRLGELNKEMKTVILSDHIELIAGACEHDHHGHGHDHGVDPHVWMSPKVVLQLLPHIKTALIESFPELKSTIDANYEDLLLRVGQTDERLTAVTRQLPKKEFLIFHPALSYLARDYGLVQTAVEQDGKEPSPAYLATIIKKARDESIPVIFIQEEYDIRNARTISDEAGIALVQINPMAYNWSEAMEELTQTLQNHLNE
ncbi:metal ABC transporter solute-binding protein, Zn/Mn family [Geofilum rubicundum]|uniref:Zinc ABC transporter, periplasmic-binding protein ZnuA n=1 Tax=Geofilum rubicundum JCM 15548 TaxID=1236989 RepID=A0A0E9LWI4_9BACT|nr:zinc ABC transporter substrate-binding protein [Geofilum rubicundum]GAO29235.1 zinc ABC transporter, periplasmic-binding protein ZnuA [Geofilum rubicundum JCM 15548]